MRYVNIPRHALTVGRTVRIKVTSFLCNFTVDWARQHGVQYLNAVVVDVRPHHPIVKWLDPSLYDVAYGDGGRGHNGVRDENIFEVVEDIPFTTNRLGDFPMKEV